MSPSTDLYLYSRFTDEDVDEMYREAPIKEKKIIEF